jgi:hypothetical protein
VGRRKLKRDRSQQLLVAQTLALQIVAQHGRGADQHGKGDSGDNPYPLHAGDNYHKNPSGLPATDVPRRPCRCVFNLILCISCGSTMFARIGVREG